MWRFKTHRSYSASAPADTTRGSDASSAAATSVDGQRIVKLRDALKIFLRRPSPRIMAAEAAACWLARGAMGRPRWSDAAIASAVVAAWPLQEWVLHKYVLHMKPREGKTDAIEAYAAHHRAHHADPRAIEGTFVPRDVALQAVPASLALFALVSGFHPRRAATGAAAYATMALLYEWTHFLVHTGVKPNASTPLGRLYARIRRNHRYHHYHHEDYWFSFTWPAVDAWLGTEPDPKTIARSATVMSLHSTPPDD